MKKIFRVIVSIVLSILCITVSIPVASAQGTDEILTKMTLEEKISQMITVAVRQWNGEDFTIMEDEVADIITKNSVGGVILFAENLADTQQIVNLTTAFQNSALSSKNKIPLFIGTDQEGGEVVRLNTGTSLPGNMAIGAINSQKESQTAGNILGSELAALGINVNFAPSLDVNSNPQNPVIGLRAFSSDPTIVSKLGVSMINGIQQNNVVASAKHFPGHGDTSTDSHTSLPTVNKSLVELEKCELVPFKEAVNNGVDMIMTAHIQFPQIEKETVVSEINGSEVKLPATLSKIFVTDILRNKLGFKGVVTTDAMNMSAISENFGMAQACILAINAGVDMLLMPVSLTDESSNTELASLIGNIKSAVKDGVIKEETINNAVKRILDLKEKRGILNYTAPTVENALAVVGSNEHHETEDDIATKAITILKNENNTLPFKPTEGQKVVLVSAYSNEIPNCQYAMSKLISKNAIPNVNYETYYYNEGNSLDEILSAVSSADYVITLTEMNSADDIIPDNINTSVPRAILDYSKENNIKCAMVSIGKPYDIANYTDASALLVAYGCNGMDYSDIDGSQPASYTYGPNIMAAIEVAFGYKNPYGTLPVDVPRIRDDGSMDVSQTAFKFGTGLLYPGTERATEAPTQSVTSVAPESSKGADATIIEKLENSGNLVIVVCLSVAAFVVLIILIVVIAKSRKKK